MAPIHDGELSAEEVVPQGGFAFTCKPGQEDRHMSVQLNHTIVWCSNKQKSATFYTDILGLPQATVFGPFLVVALSNGVSLDFHEKDGAIALQHYAFLIGEDDFDQVFGRIRERGLKYWADPGKQRPGEIDRDDGGRRIYFDDPNGHLLEVMTHPYGSGG